MSDAKEKIEAWKKEHNESRPHRALNDLSPNEVRSEGWKMKARKSHS